MRDGRGRRRNLRSAVRSKGRTRFCFCVLLQRDVFTFGAAEVLRSAARCVTAVGVLPNNIILAVQNA